MTKAGLSDRDPVDFVPGRDLIARCYFATDTDRYEIEVIERGGPLDKIHVGSLSRHLPRNYTF